MHEVTAFSVDIPRVWRDFRGEWHSTFGDLPICRNVGKHFADPMEEFIMTQFPQPEFPYRTTLDLTEVDWKVVELCEPYSTWRIVLSLCVGYKGALTILSRTAVFS